MPLGFLTSVAVALGVATGAAMGAGAGAATGFIGGLAGGGGAFFFDGRGVCADGLSGVAAMTATWLGPGVGANVGGGATTGGDSLGAGSAPLTTLAEPSGFGPGSG